MILHDYLCECGVQVEHAVEGFNPPEHLECPGCHKPMRRVISPKEVVFIGEGWYETEYGKQRHNVLKAARASDVYDDDFDTKNQEE